MAGYDIKALSKPGKSAGKRVEKVDLAKKPKKN